MVESLLMFLSLFKSKYRRKFSWFSPFLCSVLIVLMFCHNVLSVCNEQNCSNGWCKNGTCECYEGWQGSECQYCGGKIKLNETSGIITDGPGNYSVSVQCSWLIAPPWTGPRPPPIRIRLENFATECGWDHLYVYDGDSVRTSKLLAVFSGLIGDEESSWTRQVVARSGSALLHFFSDDAYAMEGFNVTYAAYSCPSDAHHTNCSNHGTCNEGTCICDRGWAGVACDQIDCPEECLSTSWAGSCSCAPPSPSLGRWSRAWGEVDETDEVGSRETDEVGSRDGRGAVPVAGHVLLGGRGAVWLVAGEGHRDTTLLYRYKPSDKSWQPIETRDQPAPRFAHSAIMYGDDIIMYGGVVANDDPEKSGGLLGVEGRFGTVTNSVYRVTVDRVRPQWTDLTHNCGPPTHLLNHCGGLHVSGHTAVLVNLGPLKKPVMLVFFGHSPHYGYLHIVQEYYIEENKWSVAATRGWSARGGFGHTAVWDSLSSRVYLHGGLVSHSEATQAPSSGLAEYDVENRIWKYLPSAPTPRYLHSATFITPGMMLVFGGNAHNDTAAAVASNPASAKCFSGAPLLYDVRCQTWYRIDSPPGLSRAAHAAVLLPGQTTPTVLIQGGFDGRLRSDAILYIAGSKCDTITNEIDCMNHSQVSARGCVWRYQDNTCLALEDLGWLESFEDHVKACAVEPTISASRCELGDSCASCTGLGCVWCGGCHPSHAHCTPHRRPVATQVEECGSGWEAIREGCGRLHSCAACHAHRHNHHLVSTGNEDLSPRVCYWDYDTVKCKPANVTENIRSVSGGSVCPAPCSTYETCANCTAEECIWCASAARCVDKNAYAASFPLGGCRVWATSGDTHVCDLHAPCHLHHNCHHCRSEPACGWCEDPLGGGLGRCMSGGYVGPHPPLQCAAARWFFTSCPSCQCNGHSICVSDQCVQPCAGRTVGEHCETCAAGHWGNPANGGSCQPCSCNQMSVSCAADSGRCHCSTKGVTGDRCDKCDVTNHYHPDHYNKGACYYDLAVDYQFTFNLSKKEDRHLTAINFRNSPLKADVDADFTIMCSSHARMNVTVRTRSDGKERPLFNDLNCTNFRYKFSKSDHQFGVEDNITLSTFFVYVYDFKPPLWIQISFSQYPKLNLQQFFITFSSCFLLLLLVAAALWKIKQRYDIYRRRQRLFVEMEQMASRPFSQVCLEFEKQGSPFSPPAPVALEPCLGSRAAVLSVLVVLPTGGTGRAPPLGGLHVASALVTLGTNHQHQQWNTVHQGRKNQT